MLMQKRSKTKMVRFKIENKTLKYNCSFKESLDLLKKEIVKLFQTKTLANDIKFLRKMAINIKQLHYEAKNAKNSSELKHHAKEVEHFLSTPIGAPFVSETTLTKAADTFGEQNPKESDLSQLLSEFAKYGQHYATQLLRAFLLAKKKK